MSDKHSVEGLSANWQIRLELCLKVGFLFQAVSECLERQDEAQARANVLRKAVVGGEAWGLILEGRDVQQYFENQLKKAKGRLAQAVAELATITGRDIQPFLPLMNSLRPLRLNPQWAFSFKAQAIRNQRAGVADPAILL